MKAWFAEVVVLGVDLLCVLSGHAFGCAVWRLLWKPYCWAADIRHAVQDYPDRHECPFCAKERQRPATPVEAPEYELVEGPQTVTTSSNASTITLWFRPKRRDAA